VLAARNRALLAERSRPLRDPAFEPWDLWITLVAGMLFLVVLVVCGLDHRFGWTPALPGPVMAAGAAGAGVPGAGSLWSDEPNYGSRTGLSAEELQLLDTDLQINFRRNEVF